MTNAPAASIRKPGWHRHLSALMKSILCLYLPFVWLLPLCNFVDVPHRLLGFTWFPGLIPALSWWGRENQWTFRSFWVAMGMLLVVFVLIRIGGRTAKLTMIVTVCFALLMSLFVRHLLLL